jgi:hypothetical protein
MPSDAAEGGRCVVGQYCPEGSQAPNECPGGEYCQTTGLAMPTGICLAGKLIILILNLYVMCFTNVNEAGIRYRYFMYSINKCTDFNKNITLEKKKKNIYISPLKISNVKGNWLEFSCRNITMMVIKDIAKI